TKASEKHMKAIVITKPGGPEVLQMTDRPVPKVAPDQVLIAVRAAGINRPDILQRKGHYPAPQGVSADIPGLEVAGEVVEMGTKVDGFQIGDRVMALVAGAGYAEYVAADAGSCIRLPASISYEEAACLPENLFTVWHNVFQRGGLSRGQRFLVHGGAGGIGYTAIQLAKDIGADQVVWYSVVDFAEQWKDEEIDLVLDSIGSDYFDKNMQVLRPDGHLVYINATQGAKVELNLLKLMQKRIHLTGSTLRARE